MTMTLSVKKKRMNNIIEGTISNFTFKEDVLSPLNPKTLRDMPQAFKGLLFLVQLAVTMIKKGVRTIGISGYTSQIDSNIAACSNYKQPFDLFVFVQQINIFYLEAL